jgi:methionyl-tRNA synthetase
MKYYLTTPIYYVNAAPHIGHAYTTLVADTVKRFHRMKGDEVYLTTGTDEHGTNVERSAKLAGWEPKKFADRVANTYHQIITGTTIAKTRRLKTHLKTDDCAFKQYS